MKIYDISRSGNILIVDYVDEEHNHTTVEYNLAYSHCVCLASDLYEYMRSENVDNGTFAMAVILDKKYCDWYWPDSTIGYHKEAVMLFAGEEETVVKKKLRPFLAKKKKVDKKLKVIDFSLAGRQMKLYLGKPDMKDYWGDDWNDAPYEHNAGSVYSEYVEDTVVVNFPENEHVVEACEGRINSPWCKEDFKNRTAPFAYIEIENEDDNRWPYSRRDFINNPGIKKFWYETPIGEFYDAGYLITEE